MDKKKAVLVIILALLLAFTVAMLIKPKQIKTIPALNQKEELITETEAPVVENSEVLKNEDNSNIKIETTITEKPITKFIDKTTVEPQEQTPFFEKLQVQEETTKVEEAGVSFDDPGIINENGVIVVTRDFKIKSPRKYSFKDFGVLAEPPIR
jgi:hypothetical protein